MAITAASSSALISGAYPQYSTDANSNGSKFIPELFSGKLVVKFYAATCLSEITNTDYEGEIKDMGDKVTIRSIPTITIRDYTKGQALTNEVPESTPTELTIDKAKYFAFVQDDIDAVQADLRLMDIFTNDSSEQMKIVIETDVFANIFADASADNKGSSAGKISDNINLGTTASPLALTKTNVIDTIVDAGTVLDEQNVPETGRWMVIPPWMAALIKKSDLKDASLTGDGSSVLRNGRLGMIDRFTLYVSNNLNKPTSSNTNGAFHALAGTNDAVTFASQFVKTETVRSTSTFGDIVRGLQVYGYKTIKPEALVDIYAYKG